MTLDKAFIDRTRDTFGQERFDIFLEALDAEPPVSVRYNRNSHPKESQKPVPWCRGGYYLESRPRFTFDPALHAGCYYVQEAGSMFLDRVLKQYVTEPVTMLDLCAAPGGKSTLAMAALPEGSTLVSNEPIGRRASILKENISKWINGGNYLYGGGKARGSYFVTSNYPRDFERLGEVFDVILCDVPCSGEGLFRKDEAAVGEWSVAKVETCARLQKEIIASAWRCLRDGGLLIYSTCTYNTEENERNVAWIIDNYDAEVLPIDTEEGWGITGSLLEGFSQPVYRLIPGFTKAEGLFMCAMRKGGEGRRKVKDLPKLIDKHLHVIELETLDYSLYPNVALTYDEAIAYLRRESLVLPNDTPRGLVTVSYDGATLGLMKNIGSRANNLYPQEWKIRSTHKP